jgi:hypothetical protein
MGGAGVLLGTGLAYYSRLGATILGILGTVVFVFGILEIVYGVGFLEGKQWSWTLGLVVAFVSLVSSIGVIGLIAIIAPGLTTPNVLANVITLDVLIIISMTAIIPVITSSVTIHVLTRARVRAFFGKGSRPEAIVP